MSLTVEAFIITWNEEQIIQHTLNHYSSFCNKITLVDNFSTDRTIDIAKAKCSAIDVIKFDTGEEIRDDILVDVKNNCWKKSEADYIVICDADEILYADNMVMQLERLYKENVVLPVVTGYNMGSSIFPTNFDIPIYEQVRYGVRDQSFDKQIIFNPKAIADINFSPGCHTCDPIFTSGNLRDTLVEFKLLHYKYLSKEYLYKKHQAYANRLSAFNQNYNYGKEYLLGIEYIDECFKQTEKHIYKIV